MVINVFAIGINYINWSVKILFFSNLLFLKFEICSSERFIFLPCTEYFMNYDSYCLCAIVELINDKGFVACIGSVTFKRHGTLWDKLISVVKFLVGWYAKYISVGCLWFSADSFLLLLISLFVSAAATLCFCCSFL